MTHQSYDKLFVNNKNWVSGKLKEDKDYFKKLAMGQSPKYLFIGCSDSRVAAHEITGTETGEIFMHRNIANLVMHTDMNLMSVLQYAVEVLKVEHIIVCGHYECGGVRAAASNTEFGLIDNWLRNIKDVYRLYFDELNSISDGELRHRRLVELSVKEQVLKLCTTSILQNAWKNGTRPEVHGWVYDIGEGLLKDLKVNTEDRYKELNIFPLKK